MTGLSPASTCRLIWAHWMVDEAMVGWKDGILGDEIM
jgi:hypothetical protein